MRNRRNAQNRLFEIAEGQQGSSRRSRRRLPVSQRTRILMQRTRILIMSMPETGFANIVGSIVSPSFR